MQIASHAVIKYRKHRMPAIFGAIRLTRAVRVLGKEVVASADINETILRIAQADDMFSSLYNT
jgi:hypothetical protein